VTVEKLQTLQALLADVDHSSPSVSKYRALEAYLANLTGLPATRIYTGYVSKAGNLSVRMVQSPRAQEASLLVALIQRSDEGPATFDAARKVAARTAKPLLLLQRQEGTQPEWFPLAAYVAASDPAGDATLNRLLKDLSPFEISKVISEKTKVNRQLGLDETLPLVEEQPNISVPAAIPALKLDPRTRRMLRNAISSHKAVMLVGPPGTGKSSLVQEIIREVREDPGKFGMTMGHELMMVTADESWTTRELVGGDSVDDSGRLRFTPGFVLQAIEEDKWLLLDEANRADMDRIFGGLLTWLTGSDGQAVTVGRVSPGSSREILLGWTSGARSVCEEESPDEEEDDEENKVIVQYLAGQEWRLIGTYNSIDAQRVFRFGLALGRRFAQVPVPPPSVELFQELITERMLSYKLESSVLSDIGRLIVRLYEIHCADSSTAMGPALFLALPGSVVIGLAEAGDEVTPLMAESYLTNFGPWLSRQDDEILDRLGESMMRSDMFGEEWSWIREQLQHLGR
jgi:hypothetical protein